MSHKKFILLSPLVLCRDDLLSLESLLHQAIICGKCDFILNVTVGTEEISAEPFHSFDELFKNNLPTTVEKLYIEAKQIEEEKVKKFIRVTIDTKMAELRVFSDTDFDWVNETSNNIRNFFKDLKPWYAGIKVALAPLFNVTMVLAIFLVSSAAIHKHAWMFFFPLTLFLYSLSGLLLGQKQKIFPYTVISTVPKSEFSRKNIEVLALLGWLILISVSVPLIIFHESFQ